MISFILHHSAIFGKVFRSFYANQRTDQQQPNAASRTAQPRPAPQQTDGAHACERAAQRGQPPGAQMHQRHTAVKRRQRQQVKQSKQCARTRKAQPAKVAGQCGQRKARCRAGKADRRPCAAPGWQRAFGGNALFF